MSELHRLETFEELREILFHLNGICEVQETLSGLLNDLDSSYERDMDSAAETLSRIEVEVVYHLGYHLKEVVKPLHRKITAVYKALEDEEDTVG